jgi:hypothetical protein
VSFTLLLLLAQFPNEGSFFGGTRDGGSAEATVEFAPASQTGMGNLCACAAITGTKGEAVTVTRNSAAHCYKDTDPWTTLSDNSVVSCPAFAPRVMWLNDGSPALGILEEYIATNDLLRSGALCNAAWSDVGTPNCTAAQASGPLGAATMDQLTDDAAGAFEGRSQAITTTAATQHSVVCWVKAGTATSATLTMVGTGNGDGDCTATVTGLSTTSSKPITCGSPAPYTSSLTAVTVTIKVGTATSDQGTLFVTACQHEAGPYDYNRGEASSYIATAGVPVTRQDDVISMSSSLVSGMTSHGCAAATVRTTHVGGKALIDFKAGGGTRAIYLTGTLKASFYDGTIAPEVAAGTFSRAAPYRYRSTWTAGGNAVVYNVTDGTSTSAAFTGPLSINQFTIGNSGVSGFSFGLNGVIGRVQVDSDVTRCN